MEESASYRCIETKVDITCLSKGKYTRLGKSDHVVLSFTLQCYCTFDKEEFVERYLYDKGDYSQLNKELSSVNWEEQLNQCSVDQAWDTFTSHLAAAVDRAVPKAKPPKSPKKKKWKPLWMNGDALKKVKKKYHAWKRYTSTKQYCDFESYKRQRNLASKAVRQAKRDFERKLAADIKKNPKCFWKYVRSKTNVKTGVHDLEKEDGSFAHTDEEKAGLLNKFFASVFTREDTTDVPDPDMKADGRILDDIQISEDDVADKLKNLNPSKSPGPDGIHPRVLKETANSIAKPLHIIFNKSLHEGKLPTAWKEAHVTAIFKKGKKSVPGNYRPVSLTSIICKIMESIIRDSVMSYMNVNQMFSDDQHGFRPGRSCVTQLLEIVEVWTSMLEEGGGVDVIYLDFRKAFDSVPHQRLLKKLEAYGIGGRVLNWIEAFLTGRKQKVIVNGKGSEWEEVVSGIPQGSVLGPILFVIFINDLPDVVNGEVKIFADDTKAFKAVNTDEDGKLLQDDLNNLCEWSNKWLLRFNVGKCGVMHYGHQGSKFKYTMQEDGVERDVSEITEEKDLGVVFDPSMNFSKHSGLVAAKANKVIGVLRRSFDYMDKDMFTILYKTLIRPLVEYGNCIWNPLFNKDRQIIEKVQRRATRLVPELKDSEYTDRLRALKLPTLAYRRLRGDMIQVYKIMHGINDVKRETFFEMAPADRGTRGNKLKIQKQHARLNIRKNTFSHRVVAAWNSLPDSVVCSQSVNNFKNGVDCALSKKFDKFTYGVGAEWQQNQSIYS